MLLLFQCHPGIWHSVLRGAGNNNKQTNKQIGELTREPSFFSFFHWLCCWSLLANYQASAESVQALLQCFILCNKRAHNCGNHQCHPKVCSLLHGKNATELSALKLLCFPSWKDTRPQIAVKRWQQPSTETADMFGKIHLFLLQSKMKW